MEYLSSSSNPNNQDGLPPETLQTAHEEVAGVNVPEQEHASTGLQKEEEDEELYEPEAIHAQKKQRVDANDYQAQIDKLQQEITELKERLASYPTTSTHELGKKCIEAKQTAATMKRKLAEHDHWLQRVSSLMETTPLRNLAVERGGDQEDPNANALRSLQSLHEWWGESKEDTHSRLILNERLRAAVIVCQENASRLLRDASENQPSFQLPLQFRSHGWDLATGTLLNDHMGFSCHRVLPPEFETKAKEAATALWNFVENDEIFRTFVPLVQDSITTHQETDCSLSCRVLQLSHEMNQQAVATVEAISSTRDDNGEENSWQISMEAVHDHYLCTFVADACGDSVVQNTTPPVKLDLGLQMSKLNMHNKFLLGGRVSKTDEGIEIFIAGSARFGLPFYCDPTFDLLQHFVSFLPVYENLYLTPLTEDKPSSDSLL